MASWLGISDAPFRIDNSSLVLGDEVYDEEGRKEKRERRRGLEKRRRAM